LQEQFDDVADIGGIFNQKDGRHCSTSLGKGLQVSRRCDTQSIGFLARLGECLWAHI
jgi:hypothetical protein